MSTLNGEPYPGFFRDEARVMKDQNKNTFNDLMSEQRSVTTYAEDPKKDEKDETGPTHPVADSYTHRFGPDDKPEVGSTHMYDYMMYIYDGSQWNLMTDEEFITDRSQEDSVEPTSLTVGNGADSDMFLAVSDACAPSNLQISDSSGSYRDVDLIQMADDIASMKEMLHKLLGNKTSPAPDQNSRIVDEAKLTVEVIKLSSDIEAYERSMKVL